MLVVVIGFVLVAAYAALGALQILVLNPVAAAPGLTLVEIQAALAAADESLSPVPVVIFVFLALVLASAVGVYAVAAPNASPQLVAISMLLILAFGAPAYFAASFSAGMALADTFMISGGDHSRWSTLFYVTSTVALVSSIALSVVLVLRRGSRVTHDL